MPTADDYLAVIGLTPSTQSGDDDTATQEVMGPASTAGAGSAVAAPGAGSEFDAAAAAERAREDPGYLDTLSEEEADAVLEHEASLTDRLMSNLRGMVGLE